MKSRLDRSRAARSLGILLWTLAHVACDGGGVSSGEDGAVTDATDGATDVPPDAPSDSEELPDAPDAFDLEILGDGFVLDSSGWEGSEYVVLPPMTGCGDGVLDPGEECDDNNRLDDDGCDWLCRLGDGAPAPGPDPTTPDYVPTGEVSAVAGGDPSSNPYVRMTLVWTGAEYATAFWQLLDSESGLGLLRMWRFDGRGRRLDAEWRLPVVTNYGGLELVWTGSGFGLFFAEMATGLWYLRLDAQGKPMGSPTLVDADPRARAPAADWIPEVGFVVAWLCETSAVGMGGCNPADPPDLVRARIVTIDGRLPGPVVTVDERAEGPPDVAVGSNGIGLVFPLRHASDVPPICAVRFVRLDRNLESPVHSGVLGQLVYGDVKWLSGESRWVTAWSISDDLPDVAVPEVRIAMFESDGTLAGPPVRNVVTEPHFFDGPMRLAAGDRGLLLLASWDSVERLSYFRADRHGVLTGAARDVVSAASEIRSFLAYDVTWSDDGFAVLFDATDWTIPEVRGLFLQHFARAE